MRVNPIQSSVKSVYKTHIDAIHFRKTDEKRLHGLDEEAEQKLFTEERVHVLKELAAKPDVYERLSSALAPSIYEHEDIKKVGAHAATGPVRGFRGDGSPPLQVWALQLPLKRGRQPCQRARPARAYQSLYM